MCTCTHVQVYMNIYITHIHTHQKQERGSKMGHKELREVCLQVGFVRAGGQWCYCPGIKQGQGPGRKEAAIATLTTREHQNQEDDKDTPLWIICGPRLRIQRKIPAGQRRPSSWPEPKSRQAEFPKSSELASCLCCFCFLTFLLMNLCLGL